ncbi:NUDIX hydrolase [Acinetobacter kanungonis]|uniref:NUDIX hydrolase n=1 Tax=Acinetobacter kanungonis TaxID=2699469 RepID=UPI00137AF2A5|nr:NUDIX domain-containing protein [Acinetobacter kanungonis]NCI78070.1 NUDIX domain-containing protein [Acinetobacter kanungonis]
MKQITVAAGIILNAKQQLLLVRKHNTRFFMQVGGKLEPDEAPEQCILREIAEEIGCQAKIVQAIGRFETAAANEPDHLLVSHVFQVELDSAPQIAAEIAELKWIDLDDQTTPLAPLTREIVLPWVHRYLKTQA